MSQPQVVSSSGAASPHPAPAPFVCRWKAGGADAAWVHVAGELDIATVVQFRQMLRDAQLSARLVVLDLRGLTLVDGAGLHVIIDAARDARLAERRLIVVRGPANIDRVFTLTGACEQVEIFDLDPAEPAQMLHLAYEEAAM